MKQKIIFHVDMDAFFASCEEAVNPLLKGKPLIVGGTRKDTRSIVSCPNYLARQMGIRTAMPLAMAIKLAPDGNFIRSTRGLYSDFSKRVRVIFNKYTPLVEPMSIDEAYLDVSEVLFPYKGDYKKLASDLKDEIKNTLGITCSIGISSNKVCSKIASKINKPDGITILAFGKEKEILHSLPVERIPGVGKATLKRLNKYGIKLIGDLLKYEKSFYENEIGMHSTYLLNVANGIDSREVCLYDDYEQKSLSKETTLSFDTSDKDFLTRELYYLLEKACARLRTKKLRSKTITVKVKYTDFIVNQKSFTKNNYSNIETDFYSDAIILMNRLLTKNKKIRLLGIRFTELKEDDDSIQENLFADKDKYKNLLVKVDKIRKKYKYDTIKFGKTFELNTK
jgi:DNA polymerase IV